jgi:hypothetical protein
MERQTKLAIIIISMLFSGVFSPGFSQAKESGEFSPDAIFAKSAVDVADGANQENPSSRPFMNLQDLEGDRKEPLETKSLDASDPRNMGVAKAPEKKPNWFERTFWLVVKSWISERNRNDPANDRRFEQKP